MKIWLGFLPSKSTPFDLSLSYPRYWEFCEWSPSAFCQKTHDFQWIMAQSGWVCEALPHTIFIARNDSEELSFPCRHKHPCTDMGL